MANIVVVGAGIAGLTGAWRLQQLGHTVVVLEREMSAGGRMRSERHGQFVIDRGAQFIASGYHNLHAVAAALGIAERVRPVARASNAILRRGRLEPGDYDSPLRLLRSRLLSLGATLRLPRILLEVWRHRALLDPRQPERAAPIDVEDMPTFLRRTVGDEAFEYVFAPAFSSTFDSDPEELSAAFVLLTLRFLQTGFRLQSFEGGTGLLTETLADRIGVRLACEVVSVETAAGGARVSYRPAPRAAAISTDDIQQREDAGAGFGPPVEVIEADAAMVAVPGVLVGNICPGLTPGERGFFREVRYGRGMIVFLMLDKAPSTLPYYGVAFPRREGLDLYGLAVDHHKVGVAPAGAGLLNVALTATAAARMWNAVDNEIVRLVIDQLGRTPIGRLTPRGAIVHRWDPMLPQFYAGYLPRLLSFLTRGQRSPRLAFAGDYLVGPYTEAALTSGLRAADDLHTMVG